MSKEDTLRSQRLHLIRGLLKSKQIECQAELRSELEKQGISCNQATLSRDLQYLKVTKLVDAATGKRCYHLPTSKNGAYIMSAAKLEPIPEINLKGFRSIVFSGNMAVIKTAPGYASSVAFHIDEIDLPEILGTIAGDDTIFCVLQEDVIPVEFIHKLSVSLR